MTADWPQITRMLDERTAEFRASHANLDAQTTRQRALSLNRWVREHNLVGLGDPEHDYRNLRNCLIGQALRSPDHESIPIISCAIYTCIAQRVGLDAHCCNFPGHIHAVVQAPPGRTVDGEPMAPTARPDRIYLDPFSDDNEVPLERLTSRLAAQGLASPAEAESFLGPARSVDILTRTGSNITATYVNVLERQDHDDASNLTRLLHSSSGSMNLISSLYASMWAELVSTPPETWAQLDFFLGRFARTWQEDAWLVERHLVPRSPTRRHVFGRHAGQSEDAWKLLRTLQRSDALPAPVFRRGPDAAEVPYRVGQVFRHTRYGYLGVITSWSNKGTRDLSQSSADDVREETTDTDVVNRLRLDSKNYYTYLSVPCTSLSHDLGLLTMRAAAPRPLSDT